MSFSQLQMSDVPLGSRIWAEGVVVPNDPPAIKESVLNATSTKSTMMKQIVNGLPVSKLCYVVRHGEGFLEVVIASTFKNADEVINMVDNPAEWYPVKPAADYGDVEALGINEEPGRQPKAVWILLRKIPYAPENGLVKVTGSSLTTDGLAKLQAALSSE